MHIIIINLIIIIRDQDKINFFKNMNLIFLYVLLFVNFLSLGSSDSNLDYKNFIVWGPGLRADFFMPVRYFYIQTVDFQSNKLINIFIN